MRWILILALVLGACAPLTLPAGEPAHTEITGNHYGDPIPEPPPDPRQ